MGKPAARVLDPVAHPLPGILTPGTGSVNVHIGSKFAWRGLPAAAAAAMQAAKKVADTAIATAEAATKAAAGTPGAPAAYAAEQAAKTAALTALTTSMQSAAGAAGAASGGGMVDIHACLTPSPVPPHGPGMVIDGSTTVLINGLPACRQGDSLLEPLGPPDKIVMGMPTVHIGDAGASGGGGGLGAAAAAAAAAAAVAAAIATAVKRQKALSLIRLEGTADQKDAELVADELMKMSDADLDSMIKNGTKVVVCRGSVTEYLTSLRGVQPRGWPAGKTWDSVPGLYDPAKNEVVISTIGHGTPAGAHVPATGEGHGSANLVVHESAHAVDGGGGGTPLNQDPAFQAARNKDIANLPAYETQPGAAGLEESFAEGMARSVEGTSQNQPNLDAYFKGR